MAGHDLEQVAGREPFPGLLHPLCVFAGRGIGRAGGRRKTDPRPGGRSRPRETDGRPAVDSELVVIPQGSFALPVDHVELVGQMQHQVALPGVPSGSQRDRLELERQVVAERSEQAELVVSAGELRDDLPDRAKHRRAPASSLLGHLAVRLGDRDDDAALGALHLAGAPKGGRDRRQDHAAAIVQRRGGELTAVTGQLDARVDIAGVPAAVPARVLHARAEHAASPFIDSSGDLGQQAGLKRRHRPGHGDSAGRDEPRCSLLRLGAEVDPAEIRPVVNARGHDVRPALSGPTCGGREKRPPDAGRSPLEKSCRLREPGAAYGRRHQWPRWPSDGRPAADEVAANMARA